MKILLKSITFLIIAIQILFLGHGKQAVAQDELASQARQWQEAILKGQIQTALKSADNMCGDIPTPPINSKTSDLFLQNGIRPEFINAGFNQWDFQYWVHAAFFKKLAQGIADRVENEDAVINSLFSAMQQIEKGQAPKGYVLWPYTIWRSKKGKCDQQAWALCELTYQLGYETQIVYLRDPETLISPHTICELRKNAKAWVGDPYFNKLIPGTSVADLADNQKLLKAIWPTRKNCQEAIKKSAYWLPSYPQDYCPRNQVLNSKLKQLLGDNCPRFGESPIHRLKKYITLTSEKDRRFPYRLWFYPIRLLHIQMFKKMKKQRER
jgi:hypothetical protein